MKIKLSTKPKKFVKINNIESLDFYSAINFDLHFY